MNFDDLTIDHRIKKNIAAMHLSEMTEVQKFAISHALLGKDIIAASKTGSGKTLAFVVPMVNRLLTQRALSKADPRALILAPTRELAKQVYGVCRQVTAQTQLQCSLLVGGENYNDQAKSLKRKPHIIVATAGRMADHLSDRHLFLNGLELLILDEADRMLELGFSEQLKHIHSKADHRKRQTMMFSATIEQAAVKSMTSELLKSPQKIVIDSADKPHKDIEQSFYFSDGLAQKDQQLLALLSLSAREQAIVFTATRADTLRLSDHLLKHDISAIALNGELLQQQRSSVLQAFSNNKHAVLVTTDLAARGLDIRNVALVINFDLPKFPEEYIHRIGRTGRAGSKGSAISLVGFKDWPSFENIRSNFLADTKIEFKKIDGIESKFKGRSVSKKTTSPVQAAKKKVKNKEVQKPKKRFDTMESTEIDNVPIKRKPRNNSEQE